MRIFDYYNNRNDTSLINVMPELSRALSGHLSLFRGQKALQICHTMKVYVILNVF